MASRFDQIVDRSNTSSMKHDTHAIHGVPEGAMPLWVADMDFKTPDCILQSAQRVVDFGVLGYTEVSDAYRAAVGGWYQRRHGYRPQPQELVTVPGLEYSLAAAIRAFTKEGEGVLIQPPVYGPFKRTIGLNNRVVVNSPLVLSNGRYEIDFDHLRSQLARPEVRMMVFCSPHNPVGRVWTAQEVEQVGRLCAEQGVVLLADEIHCDFIYPGHRHTSLALMEPAIRDNAVVCTSTSKTFNTAGLKLANIFVFSEQLRQTFETAVSAGGYERPGIFGMNATIAAFEQGEPWFEELMAYLLDNRAMVTSRLAAMPGVSLVEPEGTYLLWLDFRSMGLSPEELDAFLQQKAGLWLSAGTGYGQEGAGFQRLNIASPKSILQEAMDRLERALDTLHNS